MTISTNTLFHFTDEYNSLESILMYKFYPSYCKELIYYKSRTESFIVPMISFCDIPLSTIKHLKYGKYGIGLSKDWAIKKRLNPVLYIEKNSLLAESFLKSMDGMYEPYKSLCLFEAQLKVLNRLAGTTESLVGKEVIQKTNNDIINKRKNIIDSLSFTLYSAYFTKHYQDDLERNGEIIKDYIFYNEREWRFVPDFDNGICKLKMSDEEYIRWRGNPTEKKPLLKEVNLTFSSKDIKYIIVSSKEEIKPMISTIEKCIEMGKLEEENKTLFTKIITYKQIEEDF